MAAAEKIVPQGPEGVGVVVARRFPDGWRFLVLRTEAAWDFARGPLEPDEDPLAAAQREAWAGTSLADMRFDWGDDFRETVSYRGSRVTRYYLAESPSGTVELKKEAVTSQPLHQEFRWVTADEAEDLLPPRLAVVLDWARESVGS